MILRGWVEYYGRFRISELNGVFWMFQKGLVRWAMRRYKRFYRSWKGASRFIVSIAKSRPHLFVLWEWRLIPVG